MKPIDGSLWTGQCEEVVTGRTRLTSFRRGWLAGGGHQKQASRFRVGQDEQEGGVPSVCELDATLGPMASSRISAQARCIIALHLRLCMSGGSLIRFV